MKKYVTPAVEVEKFTVVDVITASTNIDTDIGELSNGVVVTGDVDTSDEF